MQLDFSFSLTDIAIEAMRNQSKHMLNDISSVDNSKTTVSERVDAEDNMGAEFGAENLKNLVNSPVRMTNLVIAAQTYEANIGLLGRYRQMTEIKLEL